MLQKHRTRRSRKALVLEYLEDRTLLSGNVLAFQLPTTGQVFIQGDNGNNAFMVNQTNNLGFPTLTVTASSLATPVVPGNVTALNSIPGGSANFALASVSSITITDGNGTNTILLGNAAGFSIPGNIGITVGTGVDTVALNNVATNAGVISMTGTGGSKDNFSETGVVAGMTTIMTGSRSATVTQTNVTFGFDFITAGDGNNSISITKSRLAPAPRLYAIGQLKLTAGNGNNTVTIDNISVGPTTVTLGNGNNSLTFDDSTIQQAMITIGSEDPKLTARGKNTVDISRDIVTGKFLDLSILNESGVSGILADGKTAGTGLGSINSLTMNNVQFAASGDLNVRVDDGVNYFNAGNNTVLAASTVLMELIDTGGNITVTLGDFFQSVMLGVGTVGLNDLDSNNLTVSIGKENDIVVITAIVTETETVTIGNVSVIPTPPLPTPSVLINGTVGDGDDADNLTINLGTNANGKLVGWPVNVSETVNGNMTITGGDGIALNLANTNVTGTLTITLGSGGVNNFESINLNMVTANDIAITVDTSATDVPDTVPAGANITLTNVNVLDTTPNFATGNLNITDNGVGVDIVTLTTVNVVYALDILLAGYLNQKDALGANVLSAQNVTAAFGMADGGGTAGEAGSVYQDLGGNFGYIVMNFIGH